MGAVNRSKYADWRADFLPAEDEKAQEYFVYFKISKQRQVKNMPARCVRQSVRRSHKKTGGSEEPPVCVLVFGHRKYGDASEFRARQTMHIPMGMYIIMFIID